jgi:hypothetical protein
VKGQGCVAENSVRRYKEPVLLEDPGKFAEGAILTSDGRNVMEHVE